MKSKNIKTKAKKITKVKSAVAVKKTTKVAAKVPKKLEKPKGQNKNKKFFPKDAKVSAKKKIVKPAKVLNKPASASTKVEVKLPEKPITKRAPWAKKPVENIHSTPANAGYSMRSEFDKYIAKKYKKLKDDQIKSLWINVSNQMLAEPNLKLLEVVDNCLTKK